MSDSATNGNEQAEQKRVTTSRGEAASGRNGEAVAPNKTLDIDTIEHYFSFLSSSYQTLHTVCFMDMESKEPLEGLGVVHATATDIIKVLKKLHSQAMASASISSVSAPFPTLHSTLCLTNLKGRRTENIESVRVLCVDIDSVLEGKALKKLVSSIKSYGAQMVVESSPGKYHLYWKVSAALKFETWQMFQRGLAYKFGGDLGLDSLAKIIRVPGCVRSCKDGSIYMPEILSITSECQELSEKELLEKFPLIHSWADSAIKVKETEKRKVRLALKKLRANSNGQGLSVGIGKKLDVSKVGRNESLYSEVFRACASVKNDKAFGEDITLEQAIELGERVNSLFEVSLGDFEISKTAKSAWERGVSVRSERLAELEVGGGEREEQVSESDDVLLNKSRKRAVVNGGTPLNGPLKTSKKGNGPDGATTASDRLRLPPKPRAPFTHKNPFTDKAIEERLLTKESAHLLRLKSGMRGGDLLAFNTLDLSWMLQDGRSATVVNGMVQETLLDTVNHPQFLTDLCTNREGVLDAKERGRQERTFLSGGKQRTIVSMVLANESITGGELAQFDAVPHMLHCSNGLLDMVTGDLRAPLPTDYLLLRTCVNWDEDATCPWWEDFIHSVFKGADDEDAMVDFMQELFGYSISGHISEQKVFCHSAGGSNGKSKVMQALMTISGNYSTMLDQDNSMARRTSGGSYGGASGASGRGVGGGGSPGAAGKAFERFGAMIEGRRIAIIDDIESNTTWNEGFIKMLTAPTVRARAEYEQSREAPNRVAVHMGLNRMPTPETENDGLLRRLCLVPYPNKFEPISSVSDKIDKMTKLESEGILRWAVEGYRRFKEQGGLMYPEETLLAVEEYKGEFFESRALILEMLNKGEYKLGIGGEPAEGSEWIEVGKLAAQLGMNVRDLHSSLKSEGFEVARKRIGGRKTNAVSCVFAKKLFVEDEFGAAVES